MKPEANENRDAVDRIRAAMNRGAFTYEEAEAEAAPYIKRMNKRGAEIAKEHGMKFKPLSFKYLMR